MEPTSLYKSLADPQRVRILSLLASGPLCVSHIQDILGESQVKVSKQLAFLKRMGLVAALREANWMIYQLAEPGNPLMTINLEWLSERDPLFAKDAAARKALLAAAATLPRAVTGEEPRSPSSSRVRKRKSPPPETQPADEPADEEDAPYGLSTHLL